MSLEIHQVYKAVVLRMMKFLGKSIATVLRYFGFNCRDCEVAKMKQQPYMSVPMENLKDMKYGDLLTYDLSGKMRIKATGSDGLYNLIVKDRYSGWLDNKVITTKDLARGTS
jgi:hypothetical protein